MDKFFQQLKKVQSDVKSDVIEGNECFTKNATMLWLLEEVYNYSKNEMKDKFGLKEACLLASSVGLIIDKPLRTEFRKILTRAVLNASYYNDAGNVYKVDIKSLLDRLDKLREFQAVTLIGMIQEVATQENQESLTERVKKTFFSFDW